MDKAFRELRELGWLRGEKMPRFYACQSSGCPPIVRAWKENAKHAETVRDAKTRASGLRVPAAVGDFLILESVRASGGMAVEADEDRMDFQMRRACALEGISICPETAICLEALENLVRSGTIGAQEDVLIWNTGAAQKYVECLEAPVGRIDRHKPLPPQLV
jgi:threonine synthase